MGLERVQAEVDLLSFGLDGGERTYDYVALTCVRSDGSSLFRDMVCPVLAKKRDIRQRDCSIFLKETFNIAQDNSVQHFDGGFDTISVIEQVCTQAWDLEAGHQGTLCARADRRRSRWRTAEAFPKQCTVIC